MNFDEIYQRACERKGGEAALLSMLPAVSSRESLAALADDRFLAMMCKAINQAGFNWTVIENKWPQFEQAFFGFKLAKLMNLSPEAWEAYTKDTRVVRNWQNISATRDNAIFVTGIVEEYGSFGRFLADWPENDQVGLQAYLKKHGSRLGGSTSVWFMRYVGKDCFYLSTDVVALLQQDGCEIKDRPSSKRDLQLVQDRFNSWRDQTGLPYSHLSKIAAFSFGSNDYLPEK